MKGLVRKCSGVLVLSLGLIFYFNSAPAAELLPTADTHVDQSLDVTLGEVREPNYSGWQFSPTLALREIFMDNVRLTAKDKSSDFISEVAPGFILTGGSRKVRADVTYRAQNLFYLHDSSLNDLNHELDAITTLTGFDQRFAVEGRANYSQQPLSLDGPINGAIFDQNLADTGNSNNAKAYGLTPSWQQPIAGLALIRMQYDFNRLDNEGATTIRDFQTNLSSFPGSGLVGWSLLFLDEQTDNEKADDESQQRLNLDLNYSIGPQYSVVASAGREKIEFSDVVPTQEGPSWSFGGQWHPSPQTEFELRVGERVFGSTYLLNASQVHRRLRFFTNYNEEVTSNSRQLLANFATDPSDPFGGGIDSPNEVNQADVFVQKRLEMGVEFTGVKTTSSIRIFDDSRESQTGFANRDLQNIEWQIIRQLTRKNSLEFIANFGTQDASGVILSKSRTLELEVVLRRKLGKSTSLISRLIRASRTGSGASAEYDVNLASIGIEVEL